MDVWAQRNGRLALGLSVAAGGLHTARTGAYIPSTTPPLTCLSDCLHLQARPGSRGAFLMRCLEIWVLAVRLQLSGHHVRMIGFPWGSPWSACDFAAPSILRLARAIWTLWWRSDVCLVVSSNVAAEQRNLLAHGLVQNWPSDLCNYPIQPPHCLPCILWRARKDAASVRSAFLALRQLARVQKYKRELMEAACHPSRLMHI